MKWLLWFSLLGLLLAMAIPNFVKARVTISMNTCLFNRMWIEAAKQQWAHEHPSSAAAEPTQADILLYLAKVQPMWGGRPSRRMPPRDTLPGCPIDTNVTYVLGNLTQRVSCPLAGKLPGDYHLWNEAMYRSNYRHPLSLK